MAIFSALEIVPVMHICGEEMKGLAKYLFSDLQIEEKEQYISDCDNVNDVGINNAIDAAIRKLLHTQSTKEGLKEFAGRFPELPMNVKGEMFEKDIIFKMAQYSKEMLQIIDANFDIS